MQAVPPKLNPGGKVDSPHAWPPVSENTPLSSLLELNCHQKEKWCQTVMRAPGIDSSRRSHMIFDINVRLSSTPKPNVIKTGPSTPMIPRN